MKKAGNFVAIDGAQPGIQYRIDGGEMGVFYKKTGGAGNYEELSNKPKINGETVVGIKEGKDYNLQDLLIAGSGIVIEDNGDHTATISTDAGSGELGADLIVSNPIGKYAMDDVIPEGTGFESIFRGLLSKTYYPTLTDPSASISYGAAALMKVGAMVASMTATLGFNRGSISPQYTAESPYRAGEATGYSVNLVGASVQYSDSGSGNTFTVPTFTRNTPGNVILNATVSYEAGVQPKDSDGVDYQSPLPAGSKSASKTIEFILPFYWGKSKLPALTTLDGMTEDLSKKGNKSYSYVADDEYLYVAYNASYGNLKSILDENNFENIDSWDRAELAYDGHNYIVYRSGFSITGSPSFHFKF